MTTAEWFFLQGTSEAGPFTRDQIQSLLASASISENTLLWRPGCADWIPLSAFEEFSALPPRPKPDLARQRTMNSSITPKGRAIAPDGPPALTHPNQWVDENPHPWRRYLARALDNFLWGILLMLLLGIGLALYDPQMALEFSALFDGPGGRVADIVLSFILCIIPNAILIGLTGGNLGKWLFGVCVLDEADRPIGILRAFQREVRVLVYGLGIGIPIVTLITSFIAYQKLKEDGATSWDQALKLRVVHRKVGAVQYVGSVVGVILLISLLGFLVWLNTA